MPFTKQIAKLSAEDFICQYLIDRLNMSTLIAGYDHGFGNNREKSPESFKNLAFKHNFTFKMVQPVTFEGIIVKSSALRSLIAEGDVEKASNLLGRDYSLKGKVIHGNNLGKRIGFPTANINPETDDKILPASGVYAGWVEIDTTRKKAVVNLGSRPTFDIKNEALETHLIDFDGDLYNNEIRIGFTRRLRDIVRFDSYDDLKHQITSDIEITKELIIS
jgi:riboflavin kinase/FMN adenylyltransferase